MALSVVGVALGERGEAQGQQLLLLQGAALVAVAGVGRAWAAPVQAQGQAAVFLVRPLVVTP
ncbi:hypothetical protein D3C78_1963570 [compost metagenome]